MTGGGKRKRVSADPAATVIDRSGEGSTMPLIWAAGLAGLVLISAFAVIYSSHLCRTLYSSLQTLESSQWHLQEEYGRLMLEQSTWASHHRVESVARQDLQMRPPELEQLKVVQL
jgi:cell division protein FtsL